MKHYVYKITDPITNEFYIGSRSFDGKIENDIYMGSYYTWKPKNKKRLVKTILKSNFRKRETAIKYEAKLITENIDNPLNRNYHIPNSGFHNNGRKFDNITRDKMSKNHSKYWLGKKRSEETKMNMSKGARNMNDTKKKLLTKHLIENHSKYWLGKKRSEETKMKMCSSQQKRAKSTVKCPYCDKIGAPLTMSRWHFNNCNNRL